jgi:hypothetical protein
MQYIKDLIICGDRVSRDEVWLESMIFLRYSNRARFGDAHKKRVINWSRIKFQLKKSTTMENARNAER